MTYPDILSQRSKCRKVPLFMTPVKFPEGFTPAKNSITLNYGVPNQGFFPIAQVQTSVLDAPFGAIDNNKYTVNTVESDPNTIDLANGLQYANSNGLPQIRELVSQIVERTHTPGYPEWKITLCCGACDGLNKVMNVLLDPGDTVLMEEFTFTPVKGYVDNFQAKVVPVKLDLTGKGLDVDYLTDLLANWESKYPDHKRPKAFYTIALGHNPTGITQLKQQRQQVLDLAKKYNFAIIEDDPYGMLQFPDYELKQYSQPTLVDTFLEELVESYLELDTEGRVVRVETFSKLFAPGLRLGYIIANPEVIKAIDAVSDVTTRAPLGVLMLMVNNTIRNQFGGVDGFIRWVMKVKEEYHIRRDKLLDALYHSEAYKKGYISFNPPQAGMFVSVVVNFGCEAAKLAEEVNNLLIYLAAVGVSVVAGLGLSVDPEFSGTRAQFFRLTFACASTHEELSEGGTRFCNAVEQFFANGHVWKQ